MASELHTLVGLISSSVALIESAYASRDLPLPSLYSPVQTPSPSSLDPKLAESVQTIVAACAQLIATVRDPVLEVAAKNIAFHTPACLRLAIESHAAEGARLGGEQGVHVEQLAKYSPVDPSKLGRCLRMLASQHIFKEVAPDVFANSRLSGAFDTGKDPAVFAVEPPTEWFDGTNGVAAFLTVSDDHLLKTAGHFPDTLLDPKTAYSTSTKETPFNRAFQVHGKTYFEWMASEQNAYARKRFAMAMVGSRSFEAPNAILHGMDWASLPPDSVVVDVGGGVGSQAQLIAHEHKHLKIVVQDLIEIVPQSKAFLRAKEPEMFASGRLSVQVHDFFTEQPILGAACYVLRGILHDWPDAETVLICRRLRDAAAHDPERSRVLIVSHVIPDLYPSPPSAFTEGLPRPPAPLLPHWGELTPFNWDMNMACFFSGMERAVFQWQSILDRAGLEIENVNVPKLGGMSNMLCRVKTM